MHHPNSKHEPKNTPWKRAAFDAMKTSRDRTLRTSCDENAAALAAFFDGESEGEEALRAARHLEECARCRELLQSWRQTRELLLSTPPAVAPPLLLPRVLAAWRLVALRDSLKNSALPDAAPPTAAMPRDMAPPPELARAILRATSNAARVLADAASPRVAPTRAALTRRAASRVLALAVPACLILAAFSLQPNAPEETSSSAFSPSRQRVNAPPQVVASSVKAVLKSAPPAPAKIAVASSRAVAPTGSQDAPEKAMIAETDPSAPSAAPHIAIATNVLPSRDALSRAGKIAFHRAAAPRSEFLKLSTTTGKFASLTVARNPKSSAVAVALARASQPTEIAMTFSRRAVFAAPRLTFGAPMAAARVRLATVRGGALPVGQSSEIAPRATRPDASLRSDIGLATANFRADRTAPSATARAVSIAPPRLAYATSTPDNANDGGDALDEMRAATNSYRAALDAETDGSDGNI